MKKAFNYIMPVLAGIMIVMACDDDDDFDRDVASTFPVSGEWYVHEYYDGGDSYGPYHLQIYNTSFSEDSVWISNIYDSEILAKALVDEDKTFGVTKSQDYADVIEGGTVTIENTKIIDTDSIYFEVIIYDEVGDVYDEFFTAGHRWTGLEGE